MYQQRLLWRTCLKLVANCWLRMHMIVGVNYYWWSPLLFDGIGLLYSHLFGVKFDEYGIMFVKTASETILFSAVHGMLSGILFGFSWPSGWYISSLRPQLDCDAATLVEWFLIIYCSGLFWIWGFRSQNCLEMMIQPIMVSWNNRIYGQKLMLREFVSDLFWLHNSILTWDD